MNRVGPYELRGELGRGGMGVVYRARRDGDDHDVALKVIVSGGDASAEAVARFQREARIARELNHPGIVKVLDAGTDDGPDGHGLAWFAMQLVEGASLAVYIVEREFEWKQAVAIVRDVADALAHAHGRGVLHRDIKPTNILMEEPGGRPLLTDFGLAKDTRTDSKYTRTGQTLGTPAYMSPEQARGDLAELTPATDTWSLGCVLYEVLANRPAFDGDTPAAVIGNVMTGEPAPLPGMPAGVRRLLAGCLQKEPRHRYPDAAALRDDCDQVLDGALPRLPIPGRRRRRFVLALMLVVAATGVATAIELGRRKQARAASAARTAAAQEAEQLASAGWAVRVSDPGQAEANLRAALEREPGRHAWRLQLGTVCWSRGDQDAALAAWAAVPDDVAAYTRACWLTGLLHELRRVRSIDEAHEARAAEAWRRAAAGDGPEAVWAQAGLAFIAADAARARELLGAPEDWSAALLRGLCTSQWGVEEAREGIVSFNRAITTGVPLGLAYEFRGRLHHRAGDSQAALDDYNQSIKLEPDEASPLVARALILEKRGDVAGARRDLDRAVHLAPWRFDARTNRASLRMSQEEWPGALEDLNEAIRWSPHEPEPWVNRAKVRIELGQLAGALDDCNEALKLRAEMAAAYGTRAEVHLRAGDLERALADNDRAIELQPRFVVALLNRAGVLSRMRRYAEAEETLTRAIALDESEFDAYLQRATVRMTLRNLPGAKADIDKALSIDPGHPRALFKRGNWHRRRGDQAAAEADYTASLQGDPNDADAYGNRANARQAQGNVTGALADYAAALKLEPGDAVVRLNRSLLLRQIGRAEEALEDLAKVIELAPDNPQGYLLLGTIQHEREEWRAAIPPLQRFLELVPQGRNADVARRIIARCRRMLAHERR